jgi:LysR family transcriptional regulator, hydrogen peroxide-inducible genes activator
VAQAAGPGPAGLDLEALRSFVALAGQGNLTQTAAVLSISVSGLSRRISKLEGQLGVELLDRSRPGVVLTPAGMQVLGQARKILAAYGELLAAARDVAGRAAR